MTDIQTSFDSMTFTAEQIALIEQIVDCRLAIQRKHPSTTKQKRFHTTPEIRTLIVQHLPEMCQWFGSEEFDIAVLRHFLARKTTMREGDLKVHDASHSSNTRWDDQVLNAISPSAWPGCPIVPGSKRRLYRIAPTPTHN
jgi:hypothetical protein